jgi:hypothetical protein
MKRICAALLCLALCTTAWSKPPLGTNLDGITDWSTSLPFTDIFKTSRPWISGTAQVFDNGHPVDVDERGWVRSLAPGQVVRTVMLLAPNEGARALFAGRYIVEHKGDGILVYEGGAALVDSQPGRDVIEVRFGNGPGIVLVIKQTNPANYLRDVRVYRVGTDPARETFNPLFIESLRGFRILRFMDWMETNGRRNAGSTQVQWSGRPRLDDARWNGGNGVPLEVMAELANKVQADVWFPMPHLADDDYVSNFARLARDLLHPQIKVYVEHSNEAWNRIFGQARHAERQGLALGLSADPREAAARYHARRSVEIFSSWQKEFPKARLVRVLASQAASQKFSENALAFGNTASQTDALAIAPYFGPRNDEFEALRSMTLDQSMVWLGAVALPRAQQEMQRQIAVARRFGLAAIAYEAGQHLVGVRKSREDPHLNALFDAANRDGRMGKLYDRYLDDWVRAGGGPIVHFSHAGHYRKTNRFGSLEYLTQPRSQAPKYDALRRYMETL